MARAKTGLIKDAYVQSKPKKTRQGNGKHSKRTATSRNSASAACISRAFPVLMATAVSSSTASWM